MRDIGREFMREQDALFAKVCGVIERASDRICETIPRFSRTAGNLARELKEAAGPEVHDQFRDAIYRFYPYDDDGSWDILHIHLPMNRDIKWIVPHRRMPK